MIKKTNNYIVLILILILSLGILGDNFFEGDIRIRDKVEKRDTMMMIQDMPIEGSGMDSDDTVDMDKIGGNLWPDKTVYYKFDDDLSKTKYGLAVEK